MSTESDTARSQRSSNTAAFYRYKHLAAAQVYVHTDPPASIETAIDAVINKPVSEERRAELYAVAQQLHNSCKKSVKAALGEDDFLGLFRVALTAMGHGNLCLNAKADWREEIKPTIQQSGLNWSALLNDLDGDEQGEVKDASVPPRKRQQQQQHAASDSVSDNGPPILDNEPPISVIMPPPPLPYKPRAPSPIKTPRPDISVGLEHAALISALSQHLDTTTAEQFITELQSTLKPSRLGCPEEPLLAAVPTQHASDLVFPFAVVEAKAYSTGKQVFEAENQAAVSGASGLQIQLSLDALVRHTTGTDRGTQLTPTPDAPVPLFFSVCTEGPYHELYAHYTHVEDGVRKFKQTLLEICNGVLLKGVVEFIVMVDNVLRWGTGQFLESVVERLGKVARKVAA